MTTLREAAEIALKTLQDIHTGNMTPLAEDAWNEAIKALRAAIEIPTPDPEPWGTRERFYEAIDRAVENVRQEMKIKTVTMRCKDYDVALPILDAHSGHVLVGPVFVPPQRKPLTVEEISRVMQPFEAVEPEHSFWVDVARAIERAHGIGEKE